MPELEERIAVLEIQQLNIERRLAEMSEKVDAMHELLLQLKGLRWGILAVGSIAGFFVAKLGMVFDVFGIKHN